MPDTTVTETEQTEQTKLHWSHITHAQEAIADADYELAIARRRFEHVLNEANLDAIPYSQLAAFTSYTKQHIGALIRNARDRNQS
jgi:hypothetical protein